MSKPIAILQFGATGQLARETILAAKGDGAVSLRAIPREGADFRCPQQVVDAFAAAGPVDVVVNATAYTAVDKAETEPDIARLVNTESVAALAAACHKKHIPFLHLSTDYVFDGRKHEPYRETDPTNPLGVYGRTKLEGEKAILAATDRHVILRTSWVYNAHGSNFVKTMLRLGAERDVLKVVDDQRGAPTSAHDLAGAILAVAKCVATDPAPQQFGIFHYANRGETTWRRFAEAIFQGSAAWAAIKAKVMAIPTSEYPTPAQRPLNSRLNCEKFDDVYGAARPEWHQSLSYVLAEIKTARLGETV